MKFNGKSFGGRFYPFHPEKVTSFMLSLDEQHITVEITKTKIPKTNSQLGGLHLLIKIFTKELNDHTGNDLSEERVKEMLKKRRNFTEDIFDKNTGEYIDTILKSFAELDIREASEWIEWIYAYSQTTFNITLPPLEPK